MLGLVVLAVVLALQGVQALAALYLPSLNADIIDDGVAKADVPVIWELGRIMLVISLGNIIALVAANVFVVAFGASWGPVVWVLLGEIFPNKIRARALGIAAAAQWLRPRRGASAPAGRSER